MILLPTLARAGCPTGERHDVVEEEESWIFYLLRLMQSRVRD